MLYTNNLTYFTLINMIYLGCTRKFPNPRDRVEFGLP